MQLLQSIGDGLEEKEKDFRIAAEIGQMLVEKNKQLIEQNADVEASFQVQVPNRLSSVGYIVHSSLMPSQLEKKDADLRAADHKQKQLAKRIDELQAVHAVSAITAFYAVLTAFH